MNTYKYVEKKMGVGIHVDLCVDVEVEVPSLSMLCTLIFVGVVSLSFYLFGVFAFAVASQLPVVHYANISPALMFHIF